MSQELWSSVDEYLNGAVVRPDEAVSAALAACVEDGLPPINVAPNQGKLLFLLAKIQRAKHILEIGTLGGYSAIWLARALPAGGKLVTLELDENRAEFARKNLARAGVGESVEVIAGRALDTLPRLVEEKRGPFDLVFIDADKVNLAAYFERSLELSRPGTVIVVDNVVRKGAVVDAKNDDINVVGARKLIDALARDGRVTATALQTVGSKGYDGFVIAVVN